MKKPIFKKGQHLAWKDEAGFTDGVVINPCCERQKTRTETFGVISEPVLYVQVGDEIIKRSQSWLVKRIV